jgi:hypothetical protein
MWSFFEDKEGVLSINLPSCEREFWVALKALHGLYDPNDRSKLLAQVCEILIESFNDWIEPLCMRKNHFILMRIADD